MKKFMLLHFGFEQPTPEIMEAWKAWFASLGERNIEQGGFHGAAIEISNGGTIDLPMGPDSITGYNLIHAENIEEAEALAQGNPYIASIRVYEVM